MYGHDGKVFLPVYAWRVQLKCFILFYNHPSRGLLRCLLLMGIEPREGNSFVDSVAFGLGFFE